MGRPQGAKELIGTGHKTMGGVQTAEHKRHCAKGRAQWTRGRTQQAERNRWSTPESPHHTLHSLEAASCECLRLLKLPAAAVALGPAEPARAEGHSHSVLGQPQPFEQQGERLPDYLSPASYGNQ